MLSSAALAAALANSAKWAAFACATSGVSITFPSWPTGAGGANLWGAGWGCTWGSPNEGEPRKPALQLATVAMKTICGNE